MLCFVDLSTHVFVLSVQCVVRMYETHISDSIAYEYRNTRLAFAVNMMHFTAMYGTHYTKPNSGWKKAKKDRERGRRRGITKNTNRKAISHRQRRYILSQRQVYSLHVCLPEHKYHAYFSPLLRIGRQNTQCARFTFYFKSLLLGGLCCCVIVRDVEAIYGCLCFCWFFFLVQNYRFFQSYYKVFGLFFWLILGGSFQNHFQWTEPFILVYQLTGRIFNFDST